MSRFARLGHQLYTGEVSYDFVARRRRWYIISAILIAISLIAIFGRGFTLGIEFSGGAEFKANTTVTATTVDDMRTALEESGVPDLAEATVNTIGDNQVRVQTRSLNPTTEVPKVRAAIANEVGIPPEEVAYSLIGASWGSQITERALIALGVFLLLVTLVIWAYFRNWKMSLAALVALLHDLILTIGIYALVGFTVTPATVIGVLTILGYSLYDTVVVFDKVRENVRDLTSSATRTYSEAANLALNQVLVRSINTTIIGVLPVAALLFAGAVILGEGPLKDLALALFVGMMAGAYSSIFIATPLLAQLKEREPDMKRLAKRVAARRAKEAGRGSSRGGDPARPSAAVPVGPRRAAGSTSVAVLEAESDEVEQGESTAAEPSKTEPSKTEPSNEELAAEAARTRVTVSSAAPLVPLRPLGDGAAKRPQPQHKPRSQRKRS
ncbi:MAG TPA: protein translocase subunit SecF [Microlunatus sp.]